MKYCANCGKELTDDDCYMFMDNYLQVKYFDDCKSNRFCSQECACEALMLEQCDLDSLPLDDDEKEFEVEDER